nr:hypothetical protein CFP56_56715 [Quercus suber]
MGSLDVDRRHVAVEHGGEVEWVRSRRCWGATSEPICFFQTPSFTFPRSSGTTKNAVVFGDSDLQVTKPSSDLSEAKNAVVFLQSFELRQKNKTFCVFRSGFDSISHPVA